MPLLSLARTLPGSKDMAVNQQTKIYTNGEYIMHHIAVSAKKKDEVGWVDIACVSSFRWSSQGRSGEIWRKSFQATGAASTRPCCVWGAAGRQTWRPWGKSGRGWVARACRGLQSLLWMLDINLSNKGGHWGALRRESITCKELLCCGWRTDCVGARVASGRPVRR